MNQKGQFKSDRPALIPGPAVILGGRLVLPAFCFAAGYEAAVIEDEGDRDAATVRVAKESIIIVGGKAPSTSSSPTPRATA